MKLQILERLYALVHPVTAMKAHAFEYGCDDLGQYEGDVDRQAPALHGPAMKAHEFECGCDDLGQYEGDVERQVPDASKRPN